MSDSKNILDWAIEYLNRGWSVVPMTGKRCYIKWAPFQGKAPNEEKIRKWFSNGEYKSLGVVLGAVSGNLACRDFDEEQPYHEWAKTFPELAKSLPTVKTKRGCHVYFTTLRETKLQHFTDGELRGRGCLCTLPPSPHPEGIFYEWIVPLTDEKPQQIDPLECGMIGEPLHMQQKITEVNGKVNGVKRRKQKAIGLNNVDSAIEDTLPMREGARNHGIFQFARRLKGIPDCKDKSPQELLPMVQEWHAQALPFITTKSFDETWMDFILVWSKVHTPYNPNMMEDFLENAKKNPVANLPYDTEGIRHLVALCRELQTLMGEDCFFIAVRTAGRLLGVDHTTASRWLLLLEADGWIKTIAKGGTKDNPYKATRFRYTGKGRRKDNE